MYPFKLQAESCEKCYDYVLIIYNEFVYIYIRKGERKREKVLIRRK